MEMKTHEQFWGKIDAELMFRAKVKIHKKLFPMSMEKIIQWCGKRGIDWGKKNKKLAKKYF